MPLVSRRKMLSGAAVAAVGAGFHALRAQQPAATQTPVSESAAAALRISQDAAKLLQVQIMIGSGVDYEFLRLFDSFNNLNIRVSASPAAYQNLMPDPAAPTGGRGGFRRRITDVIVLFDQVYDMPRESQDNVRRYVEAGKGIVVLHNATTDYQRWSFWYRDVVGGAYTIANTGMPKQFDGDHDLGPIDEAIATKPSSSPDKMVAPGVWDFQEYTVRPIGNHPVLSGITPFTIRDEKYKNMWFSPNIVPVLETDDPLSDKIVGWIGPNSKARVFATTLGHSADAHAHPSYRRLVHNAILWAGGRLS
jgi:type 1 glutamine amidotransferase